MPPSKAIDQAIADTYQALSPIEHCLQRPDAYIGSVALLDDAAVFIASPDSTNIVRQKITYVPGLVKLFDEILLNAYNQTVRDGTGCSEIHVSVDRETNAITVINNGAGIPIVKKKELGCYVPEMVFGHFRTSSNYNDGAASKRITGGKNGFGCKLTNIFSKEFTIETIDSEREMRYTQSWSGNMSEKSKPIIKKCKKKPFTRVTFVPDLKRFGLDSVTDDIVMFMKKRLIDVGFASHRGVRTYYGNDLISIKKPDDYMKLYAHPSDEKFIVDDTNERWAVGVVLSDSGYQQVSFVNGIHTASGGSHVDHVVTQVAKIIIDSLKAKKIVVKPSDVKNKLFVFVRAVIEEPNFDSQSKETLIMNKSSFGSTFTPSEAFVKKLLKSSIYNNMTAVADTKTLKDLEKTNGVKKSRLTDLPTLEDAAFAGTRKSLQAKLILTEGLSARTFAISAFNVIGREKYGVFPLKGKLLNVRGVKIAKVIANAEIANIVRIVGLKYSLKYEDDADMQTLRYGGIIALTDADTDGTHISGLILNFVHHFWPALVARGFLSFCITPIVKVSSKSKLLEFYTLSDYEKWLETAKDKYTTKYYKGLGTSTAKEAQDALKDIDRKLIKFESDAKCDESMSLAFDSKRANDRKQWLLERYDSTHHIDRKQRQVSTSDFINYELSHLAYFTLVERKVLA
ncbi:hypothetical protein V7S43_000158 [Phytophthora oleae]|uniref:DNA topoisomerase 2 n=1 Tax=Phytophthora oleae TaxID=2107226 RepID=A0ABD3G5G2_9STRA